MQRRELLAGTMAGLSSFLLVPEQFHALSGKQVKIRGAYSSPESFWKKGARLDDYGINAIFVHSGSLRREMIERVRSEGAQVFAEFPTLNGSGWLTRHDGEQEVPVAEHEAAWPIDQTGQKSPRQTWHLGVCPTNEAFIHARLQALKQLVTTLPLDGVWLDYLHWHAQFEDPRPRLPETCFNESCVRRFQREKGIIVNGAKPEEWARDILKNHEAPWRRWRCSVLVDFAKRCREVLRSHAPHLLLGNFQCGWRDEEYGGARQRVLGLDLNALAEVFDVMSPMLYHGRSGHSASWVEQNVSWLCSKLGVKGAADERLKIWPIVQAWNDPEGTKVEAADFETALRGGLSAGATGVMMFTLGSVAEEAAKMKVLKKVYGELQGAGRV
jgi:hypothetical protein